MASLNSDLSPKLFLGLLNGLGKRLFLDEEITDEFLRERIFSGSKMAEEAVGALIVDLERVLRRAAHENWSSAELQAALSKNGEIDESHLNVLLGFWRKESSRYHEALCKRSLFTNNTLDRVTWRVDVKASGKQGHSETTPAAAEGGDDPQSDVSAIVEMRLKSNTDGENAGAETVQFEMDREQLADLIRQLNEVKGAIARRTG